MRQVYVSDTFCAVAENGRLVEYIREDAGDQSGEILMGQVERMMPGMKSCFVDIGRKRSGFLPLSENSESFTGNPLKSGDKAIVQIRREEIGGKGAFLTRDISIPGRYVLFMPMNRHIGISSRVTDPDVRERLRRIGESLSDGTFGIVMRTSSEEADEDQIREEVARLRTEWLDILKEAGNPSPGMRLRSGDERERQLLNDYAGRGGVDQVVRTAGLTADLERQRCSAALRRVELPHGGNIVIDRCEAMTVIDVNTAGDTAASGRLRIPEQIFLETNLEACSEIARQVRLRNLSGVIIIDMINLKSAEDQEQVLTALKDEFRADRIKTVVHGMTSLGLIEITRKRSRPDWYEQETECCPACGGSGRIKRRRLSDGGDAE